MNNPADAARVFGIVTVELVVLFVIVLTIVTLLQRRLGEERIRQLLSSRHQAVGLLKGATLGAVTPFCSCSTIPIVLGLIRADVRFGTVAAFLLASPLINPIVLGATALLFGWRVALGYGVVALVATLVLAAAWERARLVRFVRRVRVVRPDDTATDEPTWRGLGTETPPALREARAGLRQLAVPLLIGVAVGAVIYGAVPATLLATVAGPGNPLAVPVAAIAGIALYVRAEVALPIGLALQSSGVGLGPIFALVIAGAGASLPEVSMLSGMFQPRLVAAFVLSVLTIAIAGGLAIPLFV